MRAYIIMKCMNRSIIIYTTPSCHFCHMAKEYFKQHNVPYTEYDVSKDVAKQQEMIAKTHQYGVPVIIIKGKIVLDIGGYIGDTAVYFSKLGASMVYVYEPHPVLYQILTKNIELNNLKNIKTKKPNVKGITNKACPHQP